MIIARLHLAVLSLERYNQAIKGRGLWKGSTLLNRVPSGQEIARGMTWGRSYFHPSAILKPGPFILFQEVQSRLSGAVLIALAVFVLPVWIALLVMLSWSFVITTLYEFARKKALPDLMETQQQGPKSLSWTFNILKTYSLGWWQYGYCKLVRSKLRKPETWVWTKLGIYTLGAMVFGGMISVHHILKTMGCSSRKIFWGNMLARILALPGKGLQVTAWIWTLHFVGTTLGLGDLNDVQLKNIIELREVL